MVQEIEETQSKTEGQSSDRRVKWFVIGSVLRKGKLKECAFGRGVPMYASRMPNPMAALAVIKVLSKMLQIGGGYS
jgi:hypothetical protein